jgi:hypothetical protein
MVELMEATGDYDAGLDMLDAMKPPPRLNAAAAAAAAAAAGGGQGQRLQRFDFERTDADAIEQLERRLEAGRAEAVLRVLATAQDQARRYS